MSKDMYDMLFDIIPHKNKYILEPKEIADYILDLENNINVLTNNWNELRKHIAEYLEEWENSDDEWVKGKCNMASDILYDMEEIRGDINK